MSDKENVDDELEGVQQFVDHPVDNEEKKDAPTLSPAMPAVATAPVLQTMPVPAPAETPVAELKPSFLSRIKPSSSWFLKKKAQPTGTHDEDDGTMWAGGTVGEATVPLVPATVPGYEMPPLLKLLQQRARSDELIRAGATPETLHRDEVTLDDFYRNGYSLRDVHAIIGDFDALLAYGFTRQHLTGAWYMDQLCALYSKEKPEVCQRLGFRADDFIRTHVTPQEMAALGINAEVLKTTLKINFASIFSMNIRFDEFADTFGLTKESLRALNLNPSQKIALSAHRGWTPSAVRRKFDLSIEELADVWFMLDLD
jgi:hypothetical protein